MKAFFPLKFGLIPGVVGQVISPPLHLGNYQNRESQCYSFIHETADHTTGFLTSSLVCDLEASPT